MEYVYNQVIIYCFSVKFRFISWIEIWNCYNITVSAFCADQIQVSYKYILLKFPTLLRQPASTYSFQNFVSTL